MKQKLLPLALGALAIGTTEFVMMGLLPDIAKAFAITIPQAGYIISAYALGVVVGAPTLVALAGSIAPKKIMFGLMLMFTVFNTLSALSPNAYVMFLARFCSGLPHGAFLGVGSVIASRIADKGRQAYAISFMFSGLTVANLLTVPLGTWIGHHYSWRWTFAGIGLLGLITLFSIYKLLPALALSRTGNLRSELKVFKKAEPWLIFLITAVGTGGLFCWLSYIAPLMMEVSHFQAGTMPWIMTLAGLGIVTGAVLGGRLTDRVGPLKAIVYILLGMAASLVIIFAGSKSQPLSLVMTFLAGCFAVAPATPIQLLMIRTAQGAEMLGASLTQAAFNIANALGAFLGGLPIAMGLGYAAPNLVGAAMNLAGIGIALYLAKRFSKEQYTPPTPVCRQETA